ncbi:hypothetical protein LXL04_010190 [Taraxacum kok-saghyz]
MGARNSNFEPMIWLGSSREIFPVGARSNIFNPFLFQIHLLASSVYRRWPPSQSSIVVFIFLYQVKKSPVSKSCLHFSAPYFFRLLNCQVDIYIDLEDIDEEEEESDLEIGCTY